MKALTDDVRQENDTGVELKKGWVWGRVTQQK